MNWQKSLSHIFHWILLVVILVSSSLVMPFSTLAGADHTVAVRLATSDWGNVSKLGLETTFDVDYGTFHWLELTAAAYDQLKSSGIPHTSVPDAGVIQITGFRFDPINDGEPIISNEMLVSEGGEQWLD